MPRGGKRIGAGPKKKVKPQEISGPLAEKRNLCQRVLEVMDDANWSHCAQTSPSPCMLCLLVWDCRDLKDAQSRHWTVEMAQGKAVHHVNHLHDKPIEMNVNVKLSEIIRGVRERKREYERNRR